MQAGSGRPGRAFRIRASASSASSTSAWTSTSSAQVAELRPDWQFVMIGPVVKIDPAHPAAAAQHPLARRQVLRRAAALPVGLGRRLHAVRPQRGDAVHQPDQDAGIPGRRRAGRLDADHRRGAALRREGPGRDRHGRRARSSRKAEALLAAAARRPGCSKVDRHLAAGSWDKTWASMHKLMVETLDGAAVERPAGRFPSMPPRLRSEFDVRLADCRRRLCRQRARGALASERNERVLAHRPPHLISAATPTTATTTPAS